MDGLTNIEFSFKNPFAPLTTKKAIWIMVIVGFIVFGNSLFNGFVWDDIYYIAQNPDVRSLNLAKLFGPNIFNYPPFYRPLAAVFFTVSYSIFTNSTFFYHLIQVLLHISNSVLIYILFNRYFRKDISLLASLLFLAHPIQVESVVFISQTINPLSMFFGLSGLLLITGKKVSSRVIFLTFIFFNIAIFLKEAGVIFFILVLIYKMLFRFRLKEVMEIFFLSILSGCIYLFIRLGVGGIPFVNERGGVVPIAGLGFLERLTNIPAVIFYYLKTLILPVKLAINQQWVIKTVDLQSFYIPLLLEILISFSLIAYGIYLYKRDKQTFRVFIFFALWLLVGLLPILQIIPIDMTVADRFLYFAFAGFLGLLAVVFNRMTHHKSMLYLILIISLLLFSIRTMVRNVDWDNNITLYSHDLKIAESPVIYSNLGNEYMVLGQPHEAFYYYKKAINISQDESTFSNLGYAYERLGDFKKAKEYYLKSFNSDKYPDRENKLIHSANSIRLGFFYIHTKQFNMARSFIEAKLTEFPQDGVLWEGLAIAYYNLSNHDEAKRAILNAKKLAPFNNEINDFYLLINNK